MEYGSIEREITIEATPETVFEVVTSPEHLKEWWPDDAVFEPKPGARLDQSPNGLNRVFGLIDARKSGWSGRLSSSSSQLIIWGETNWWTSDQQILWGDQLFNPAGQQILWGDQVYNPGGQQILWGDQVYSPSGQQILWGDQTTGGQQILWGDSSQK